jgi:tetratricopeptide (TPR) repeat protein
MYKESVEVLREFLDANPNCDSLWFALANIHEYNKNYSSALKCLNICTDILRKSRNPDRQNLVDCERKTREIQQKIKDEN